jgi:hypothetical protein
VRRAGWAVAAVLAAGCAAKKEPEVDALAMTRDASCYTVDLFFDWAVAPPGADVPEKWRRYAGVWGSGKWDGQWCHDLYVLNVTPAGEATVIETHAPLPAWGRPASAFRRTGRIGEDGRLRIAYGQVVVEYWLEGDTLLGRRQEPQNGELLIALTRKPITSRRG